MEKKNSSSCTFWELIREYQIIVPPLQRDYAQGRENIPEIEQIRNSLVNEMYEALHNDTSLVLNFIYGEKNEDRFIPIDGQQRLTTLFLLHWYIFARAGYADGIEKLKGFSYKTRLTSERFCENLCKYSIDFTAEKIRDEICGCFWLTGNFRKDPTVRSMLIMLDTIHSCFSGEDDFEALKDKLIGENCPISFLWLPMDKFQKTNDLYIKMNARGKQLTDFEIFKAKLQNSPLIKILLGPDATEQDRILYISRYNNQYAEFFYRFFQGDYDEAMLAFIKENVRDQYLSYASRCGVNQKDYRDEYQKIHNMNGSILIRYLEEGGKAFPLCDRSAEEIVNGINRATRLIEYFASMPDPLEFENTHEKEYYSEKTLFISNYQKETLADDVLRYATYAFFLRFGLPKTYEEKNAYCMWKRFAYNIVSNSAFKSHAEYVCEAFVFFQRLADQIPSCDELSVLKTIAEISESSVPTAIGAQAKEETIKALLMRDIEWRKNILDAENYFTDGQIGFLLESAKIGTNEWDIAKFKKYAALFKRFFEPDKKLKLSLSPVLFEQALLCMPDSSGNHTAHLQKQPNAVNSWGFLSQDYRGFLSNSGDGKKRQILRRLLDRLEDKDDAAQALKDIVSGINENDFRNADAWKLPFIRRDLFNAKLGKYRFSNYIYLSENRKTVLLLAGSTTRALSMELNTYLLWDQLKYKVPAARQVLFTSAAVKDPEGFPLRYIDTGTADIGYSHDLEDASAPYLYRTETGIEKLTLEEVIRKATSQSEK